MKSLERRCRLGLGGGRLRHEERVRDGFWGGSKVDVDITDWGEIQVIGATLGVDVVVERNIHSAELGLASQCVTSSVSGELAQVRV